MCNGCYIHLLIFTFDVWRHFCVVVFLVFLCGTTWFVMCCMVDVLFMCCCCMFSLRSFCPSCSVFVVCLLLCGGLILLYLYCCCAVVWDLLLCLCVSVFLCSWGNCFVFRTSLGRWNIFSTWKNWEYLIGVSQLGPAGRGMIFWRYHSSKDFSSSVLFASESKQRISAFFMSIEICSEMKLRTEYNCPVFIYCKSSMSCVCFV